MGVVTGVLTLASVGNSAINLGTPSTPTAARFVVQNKTGIAEAVKHVSIGQASGAGQRATSYFKDVGAASTFDVTDRCISVYERVSGVVTEVLRAELVSFNSNGLTLHVTIANAGYNVYLTADY